MKKVRNIRRHTVLIDTLKTETSNFVLNPSLHWKLVECSQQCCCTCMPGLSEDKSGCMILYALKLIQLGAYRAAVPLCRCIVVPTSRLAAVLLCRHIVGITGTSRFIYIFLNVH